MWFELGHCNCLVTTWASWSLYPVAIKHISSFGQTRQWSTRRINFVHGIRKNLAQNKYFIYIYIPYLYICFRHWPSITSMSPQSHCGDEEDGRTGLSSWRQTSLYMYYALCFVHVEHAVCHEPISVYIYYIQYQLGRS